jgi:DNA-binding PadR family transcriptional regulator
MTSANQPLQPLTQPAFYVLLALHRQERHGYEIMKQVERDSAGQVTMGPGTLYGIIKRQLAEGLIAESGERPDPERDDERRRYYLLTSSGRARLGAEIQRFEQALHRARELGIQVNGAALWLA